MFMKDMHVKYFKKHLQLLPSPYISLDQSRITVLYFCVIALDMLHELDNIGDKQVIIDYIYLNQLNRVDIENKSAFPGYFGFIGSTYAAHNINPLFDFENASNVHVNGSQKSNMINKYQQGHIAMIYTALASLKSLGDDLERVNKAAITDGLKSLQQSDGSFACTIEGSESDIRFVYCACAISTMLNDWSGIDIEKASNYVIQCITYEGGMGLTPGLEAQGGGTYCGFAALCMMNRVEGNLSKPQIESLRGWCFNRGSYGYNGRTNKAFDSCYSFWIGATIAMMESFHETAIEENNDFLVSQCQNNIIGGFGKHPGSFPDILHSFYSLAWMSMSQLYPEQLKEFDVVLGICKNKS